MKKIQNMIEWIEYDGTPETFPEHDRLLLVSLRERTVKDDDLYRPDGDCFLGKYFECNDEFRLQSTWEDDTHYSRQLLIGDMWCYFPMPPSG